MGSTPVTTHVEGGPILTHFDQFGPVLIGPDPCWPSRAGMVQNGHFGGPRDPIPRWL